MIINLGVAPTDAACGINARFAIANGWTVRHRCSNIDAFSDARRILKFNAKIPNSAIDLGVPKQQLDRAKVASIR